MKQFALVWLIVLSGPAHAQAVTPGILSCKTIKTDTIRLLCYDREVAAASGPKALHTPATPPETAEDDAVPTESAAEAAPPPEPAKPKSKWYARQDTSAMTDDTNHFVTTTSIGYHQCSQYGSSGPITLWARCLEDTTALIISGDCHLASGFSGYGEVTWRTDEDQPQTREFEASTDSSALGLWSGRRAIPALKELLGKERLVVRFTPFGMSPIEATFDIAGLEEAIGPLREECGW